MKIDGATSRVLAFLASQTYPMAIGAIHAHCQCSMHEVVGALSALRRDGSAIEVAAGWGATIRGRARSRGAS